MTRIVPYTDLQDADLIVDAIYEGDPAGSISNEPISRLRGCGNQGGFRKVGSPAKLVVTLLVSNAARECTRDRESA